MAVHESGHDCQTVAVSDGMHRIIRCRDNIQWIVQYLGAPNGKRPWRSLSFCVSKRGLEMAVAAREITGPVAEWVRRFPAHGNIANPAVTRDRTREVVS